MSVLETLLAIEEIKKLKARYFRCLDMKDAAGLRTVFTDDAVFDVRGALETPKQGVVYTDPPVVTGGEPITALCIAMMAPLISVHHGHMPEIEILSAEEARGLWPMNDLLIAPAGGPFRVFRGYGHYRETYRKVDGAWRIATLRLTRLLVETEQ